MAKTLRTFIAVEVTRAAREQAARLIRELAGTPAAVKWVEPENLHLTLKFLGEVDMRQSAAVCQAVRTAVAELDVFTFHLHGAGAFPSSDQPRTLWVGVDDGQEDLIQLHDNVEAALAPLDFRSDGRRFVPHMTIGRVRYGRRGVAELGAEIESHADVDLGPVPVREVIVYSSELTRNGPYYEALDRAPLAG